MIPEQPAVALPTPGMRSSSAESAAPARARRVPPDDEMVRRIADMLEKQ